MYFVWINGLCGPEPQIWRNDITDGVGKNKPTLFKIKLEGLDLARSIDELIKRYPCNT